MKQSAYKTIAWAGLFFLILSSKSFGQGKGKVFNFSDLSPLIIELPSPDSISVINLTNIYVEDVRFETTMMGFNESSYLTLDGSVQQAIGKYVRSSFKFRNNDTSDNSVFVFIRKLWLSNELKLVAEESAIRKNYAGNWLPGISCKIDCYYRKQNFYYPLCRLDTNITVQKKLLDNAPLLLKGCLSLLCQKIISSCASFNTNKKKGTESGVSKYYLNRFDIPILTANKPEKGLYKTFNDFQNNKPFNTDFEVRNDKASDMVYEIDSTGNQKAVRDIWGYCDGTTAFIKSADNYFALNRIGNGFYLKGFKDIDRREIDATGRPIAMDGRSIVPSNRRGTVIYKFFYKFYHLDMENGRIF